MKLKTKSKTKLKWK